MSATRGSYGAVPVGTPLLTPWGPALAAPVYPAWPGDVNQQVRYVEGAHVHGRNITGLTGAFPVSTVRSWAERAAATDRGRA